MGDKLSDLQLYEQFAAGGEGREALVNPNTNTERFRNVVAKDSSGLFSNFQNLGENLYDSAVDAYSGEPSELRKQYGKKARKLTKDLVNSPTLDGFLELAKIPFQRPESKGESLFGSIHADEIAETARMDKKDLLAKQYGEGGAGELAGDFFMSIPTARIGSMASTNMVMKAGGTKVDVAKAISADMVKNATKMGVAEGALMKAYGRSDEEAGMTALAAAGFGAIGTPLVAGSRIIGKKATLTDEEMAQMAGGGKPPEQPKTTARKEMQNVKANPGARVKTPQKKVVTPKVEKFDETFDDTRGRNYSDSWLNSHQGKSTSKASVIKLPDGDIKDPTAYANSMKKSFKSRLDNLETYGSTDTKFKDKGYMTKSEKVLAEKQFEKDLLFKLSKDKRLSVKQKREIREQAKQIDGALKDTKGYYPKGLDEQTEVSFGKQKVKYNSPTEYNAEMTKQWEHLHTKRGKGFVHGNKAEIGPFKWNDELQAIAKESPEKAREFITKNVKGKLDDKEFIEAIDKIETRMATKGQKFDINKVPDKVRYENQDEYYKISDYIERKNDIALLEANEISSKEFAWREGKRLDAQAKRNNIQGNKFESEEDLAKAIDAETKTYSDIGLYRKTEAKEKTYSDSPNKAEDKTDFKTLETKRVKKLEALEAFRTSGKLLRSNTNKFGRGGEPVLTKSEIRDIKEFADVLTNDEILNKTQPLVRDSERQIAIEEAQQIAKNKVKSRQAKKLGIDFNFLPRDIKFSQTIMDAKNSMGQIASVITGSEELAGKVFLREGQKELREIIAEEVGKRLGIKIGKAEIKTPFMIKGYGSEKDGMAKAVMKENPWIKTEEQAYKFIDTFNEEFGKQAKPLSDLMNTIKDTHSARRNPVYEWTMPDGFKVKFDLSEYKDYVVKNSKGQGVAKVRTTKVDKMSRALLPNIFHSIDGWIAREMRQRMKIQSTHDAFHIPKGREAEADKVYRDILKEINDGDVMGDIMSQLGVKYNKVGKLEDDFFADDRKILGVEHKAGTKEQAEKLKPNAGKQMSKQEVMRDFMTTDSHRNHEYFKMVDAMIDEAVISKHNLGIARENDDVFERALAYALQGNKFDKSKAIEPPKGSSIDKDAWYQEQEALFNEFRAKAEFNSDLGAVLKGDRKYFTKEGEVIGAIVRSRRAIREESLRFLRAEQAILQSRGLDLELGNPKQIRESTLSTKKDIENGDVHKVTDDDIEELLVEQKYAEHMATKAITERLSSEGKKQGNSYQFKKEDVNLDEAPKSWKDDILESTKENLHHVSEKFNDSAEYKQYQKLVGITKNPQKAAEQAGDTLKKYVDNLLKGEDQVEWSHKLFETDARVLREFSTEAEAMSYFKANEKIYNIAKAEIDQLAKAVGREEHQIGAFMNNAKAIAEKKGLKSGDIETIDKLVSIKAMEQNDAWKFYEKHYGTDRFNDLMDIAESIHRRSATLFNHNSSRNKQVKGYMAEYYDGGKRITDDGKVVWDAEAKYEDGALGLDLSDNKVGKSVEESIDNSKFSSEEAMIRFAEANNLKITEKGWRKIPSARIKDEAGRKHGLSDRLGMTEASVRAKTAQFDSAVRILTDEGAYSKMFSKEAKDGFITVTKEQTNKMPWIMQEEVKFVNAKYAEKLLGRQEPRLIRKNATQAEKIADKLLQNVVTLFKQSVVLKNPSSYKSAILVNFSTNLLVDGNIMRAGRNAKKSYDAFKEFSDAVEAYDLAVAGAKGEQKYTKDILGNDTKVKSGEQAALNRLMDTEVQKYLDLGMSINTIDGVRGNSSMLTNMMSDATGNRFDKIGNEVMLNQRATSGNMAKNVFSYIDFQGRYMAIKSLENNGMSSADAVRRANDLFGQMDDMAPAFIQAIDKYGAFPFAKWFASVAPSIAKATKNNPKKALALTLALYYASSESDIMLSNVSPIEGAVDMLESGVTGDGWVWDDKLATSLIPGIYRDMWKYSAYQMDETQHWREPPAIFWKNRMEEWKTPDGETIDYRGITQKTLDSINPLGSNEQK